MTGAVVEKEVCGKTAKQTTLTNSKIQLIVMACSIICFVANFNFSFRRQSSYLRRYTGAPHKFLFVLTDLILFTSAWGKETRR